MSNAIHTFLPWARRGLASQIQEIENFGPGSNIERATIAADAHIKVKINGNITSPPTGSPVNMNLQIIGPGDILGIHKDVVVKTEPHDWITNFEPHSFPFIDFFEEDFPWRYSPATATASSGTALPGTPGGKLRPWITLIVLKEDEFKRVTLTGAPLNSIAITEATTPVAADRPLPLNSEVWAWAHVSMDSRLTGTNKITDLNAQVNAKPSVAISRIICPRKLEDNTSYYAFLIPTYETGRLTGLGITIPNGTKAQAPAWDHTTAWPTLPINPFSIPPANNPTCLGMLPVYYEWYFRTGATGDFEYLVRQVKPRVADLRVGKRLMDISSPGYGLTYSAGTPNTTAGTEWLEGALVVPGNNAPVFVQAVPPIPPTLENNLSDKIADFVNLGEDMLTLPVNNAMYGATVNYPQNNGTPVTDDPIVAPPLYGRWHALENKVDRYNNPNLWLNELNLDPRYRVAASLGGDYVRKYQEFLMDEAWNQLGRVLEANRQAALAQLAMETSKTMHVKHIASQSIEQLLPMTSSVHAKISTGTTTLRQNTIDSSLPESASSSTFRKITRPTGVLVGRLNPVINTPTNDTMGKMIQGNLTPVEVKQEPGPMATTFQLSLLDTAITKIQNVSNPAAISFNITLPLGPPMPPNSAVSVNFHDSFSPFNNVFDSINWQPPTNQPNLSAGTNVILDSINPGLTHVLSFYSGVSLNGQTYVPPTLDAIVPIMAAPLYILPMYESLKELGMDYFLPNLNLIPQNSVTILESNQKFIEAFLAGANYEMGRELLWREYPTDQRGTYFQHFWSSIDNPIATETNTPDITPIHTWKSNKALGTNSMRTLGTANLVLAIRGDFLKKFPNAMIFAVEADWDTTKPNPYTAPRMVKLDSNQQENPKYPIFSAKIEPDITFLGFDLTPKLAKGNRDNNDPINNPLSPGWFFVIMERTGELRFGLDEPDSGTQTLLAKWSELTWSPNHVAKNSAGYLLLNQKTPGFNPAANGYTKKFDPETTDTNWQEDSAAMAQIVYQEPAKVLIHANEMIP